jgi:hypothetical protein
VKDVAACDHIGLHALMSAQHASHVLGLRPNDGCGGLVPMLGNPTAARHLLSIAFSSACNLFPPQKH